MDPFEQWARDTLERGAADVGKKLREAVAFEADARIDRIRYFGRELAKVQAECAQMDAPLAAYARLDEAVRDVLAEIEAVDRNAKALRKE